MNVPPTPDESASAAPRSPRMVGPPASRAPVLSGAELDETMGPLAEAGSLPDQVGLDAPSTPTVEPAPVTPPNVSLPASTNPSSGHADAAMPTTTLGVGHGRDADDDGENRPTKHPRILQYMNMKMIPAPHILRNLKLMVWRFMISALTTSVTRTQTLPLTTLQLLVMKC